MLFYSTQLPRNEPVMHPEWSLYANQRVLAVQATLHLKYCAFPHERAEEVLVLLSENASLPNH